MKPAFILILLLAGCTSNKSRWVGHLGFNLLPGRSVSAKGKSSEQNIVASIFLQAVGKNAQLNLFLVEQKLPRQWEFNVCDNVACHLVLPDMQILNIINPSDAPEEHPMEIVLKQNHFAGQGWLTIKVQDSQNKDVAVNLKYQFCIE